MSRRTLQSICIVLVFLIAFVAVILLGIRQGRQLPSLEETGIELDEKVAWDEAIASVPQLEETSTVYVTQSGTKYHLSPECSGLRRAKEIIGTQLSSAVAQGKDLCSICGEK